MSTLYNCYRVFDSTNRCIAILPNEISALRYKTLLCAAYGMDADRYTIKGDYIADLNW